MSFLELKDKTVIVFGVANKRSVAHYIARALLAEGAKVICSVRTPERQESVSKLLPECEVYVCDVAEDRQIDRLVAEVGRRHDRVHGLAHSIAFANYEGFSGKFHEVSRGDFLQCVSVSCYSLIAVANAFKGVLDKTGSVVAISISTTRMAVESYGYMAPAKAALDSSIAFLAKSFSQFSEVRFNSVCAGLLKTSASAGIPGYAENFMYAERATLRKRALSTEEVANAAVFLLSPRSSGINAQGLVVDVGMGTNYFDAEIVQHALNGIWPTRDA